MLFVFQDNSLVVGGGDNNVHILDLEQGVFKVSEGLLLFVEILDLSSLLAVWTY